INHISNRMLKNLPVGEAANNKLYDYENTFIHFTGQAIASAIYGERAAKFVADIHERYKQPYKEIASGNLEGISTATIEDMYRDLVNNEYGRSFGSTLRERYNLDSDTEWTNELSANVLN